MKNLYYMLNPDKTVSPCDDLMKWAAQFDDESRQVDVTKINGNINVSTVFLGIDHGFGGGGRPVLFETMVFGGKMDEHQVRYCTYEEAKQGHRETVLEVQLREASDD